MHRNTVVFLHGGTEEENCTHGGKNWRHENKTTTIDSPDVALIDPLARVEFRLRQIRDLEAAVCGALQAIVSPPSITIVWPDMKRPAGPARHTAIPATSSGSPMRRRGRIATRARRVSGGARDRYCCSGD